MYEHLVNKGTTKDYDFIIFKKGVILIKENHNVFMTVFQTTTKRMKLK
jgi:hypothetical protein